jgi:hypothetical protein
MLDCGLRIVPRFGKDVCGLEEERWTKEDEKKEVSDWERSSLDLSASGFDVGACVTLCALHLVFHLIMQDCNVSPLLINED